MGKNILVISASLRRNSNSDALADEFMRGAIDSGSKVKKISLAGKKINFCRGCLACQKIGHCVIEDDDANAITEEMKKADAIAFATPVYYYGMSGQLKTVLDRANSLFSADYAFRDIYLLASAAEDEDSAVDGTREGIEWWASCFEKAELKGIAFAKGVEKPGEIKGNKALSDAYKLGLNA